MISEDLRRRAGDAVINYSMALQQAYKLTARPALQIDPATFPNAESIEKFVQDMNQSATQLRKMKTVGDK
jgi:hypothetical protein